MYDNLLGNVPTDLYIGGKWRKSSDNQRFDVIDPATEKPIASVASASVEDAKAAVDAASAAMEGWAAKKPRERAEVLRKAFELIIRDTERFAKLMTIENGKALTDSRRVTYAASSSLVRRPCAISAKSRRAARRPHLVQHRPAASRCWWRRGIFPPPWRPARLDRRSPPAALSCSSLRPRRRLPCWP
jgi:succinate-semialdehyde dehydrogenase/glutarate-semialdehyde dehydrogenase